MQILFKLPEFREAIKSYKTKNTGQQGERLVMAMQDLFIQIEKEGEAFKPIKFLQTVFACFPQFAERDQHSMSYQQQDADECFQLILNQIAPVLDIEINGQKKNLITDLFQITLKSNFINKEDEAEVSNDIIESVAKVGAIIDNQMNPVSELSDGIKIGLEDELEKQSEKHGKNCLFTKKSRMLNLPNYLIVQKIRFVWRAEDKMGAAACARARSLR